MDLFLTIDAGGTSTRAVVHDAAGICLGHAVGGGGNPTASGVESVAAAVHSTAAAAFRAAGVRAAHVGHALAAMAGSAVGMTGVGAGLLDLGVAAPLGLASDLEAIFFAGTPARSGLALVSGTGAAAIVVRDGVTSARSDGRGWLLGDVGSGYWIARRVVRAVAADLDGRGPRTALTDALLTAAGVTQGRTADKDALLDELVTRLYAIPTPGIAVHAPLAFELADDAVARQIVAEAARGLAGTVAALETPDPHAPLVVGGSVLFHQRMLRTRVTELLHERGWRGTTIPVTDGTLGAITMNLRSAGVCVDEAMHARISLSLEAIRARP